MKPPFTYCARLAAACALPLTLMLAGCGGVAGSGEDSAAAPAAVAGADYRDIVSYCEADESVPGGRTGNGWVTAVETLANGINHSATLISPDGNPSVWNEWIALTVPVFDYRGVASSFGLSPNLIQTRVMGAAFPTVLPKSAVACVIQLSKITYTRPLDLSALPGWTGSAPATPSLPYSLSWKSYWDAPLPFASLPGYAVDGFEFVSNFIPREGKAYFNLQKARFASVQGLSICYLAPRTATWDCATPTIVDLGASWQVGRPGMKPGSYLLVAAAR